MSDFYKTLGVGRDAAQDEIKSAYKKAALRWHPDKNPDDPDGAELMFQAVAEAFAVLSDPQKRALYDRSQAPPAPSREPPQTPAHPPRQTGTSSDQHGRHFSSSSATFQSSKQASGNLDPFGGWGNSESWEDTKWGSSDSSFRQQGFGRSGGYINSMPSMGGGRKAGLPTATRPEGVVEGTRLPAGRETVWGYPGQTQSWHHGSSQRWGSCNDVHQSFSRGWR